jgi:hypothetical protein
MKDNFHCVDHTPSPRLQANHPGFWRLASNRPPRHNLLANSYGAQLALGPERNGCASRATQSPQLEADR